MPKISRHLSPSRFRVFIQTGTTLFCLYCGFQFYKYFQWATGATSIVTPKPPSVEGFLPISALMAAKRFFLTGEWDMVHPAGLTLFFAIIGMALLFRKGFCGYICPVGLCSALLEKAGRKLGFAKNLPKWLQYALYSIKYCLLAGFLWGTLFAMDISGINAFLRSPYNYVADAKMLTLFTSPTTTTVGVLLALMLLSLLIRNAWCRFLCPYGALLGLLALFSPVAITRKAETCVNCKKCNATCPSGIQISQLSRINTPECIGCTACIEACPVPDCLHVSCGKRRLPYISIGVGCMTILLACYFWAVTTGHWYAEVPEMMIKMFYKRLV